MDLDLSVNSYKRSSRRVLQLASPSVGPYETEVEVPVVVEELEEAR